MPMEKLIDKNCYLSFLMLSYLNLENLKFEIQKIKVRNSRSLLSTNYFDQNLFAKSFKVIQFKNSLVFIDKPRKSSIARFYYFLAAGDSDFFLQNNVDYDLVCDVLVRAPLDLKLDNFLAINSFKEYAKLKKMYLTNDSVYRSSGLNIKLVERRNSTSLSKLFKNNFDSFSERPPDIDEIEFAIKNKEIYCKVSNFGEIMGFYWNSNKKFLSELRYLFVVEKYRGQGIGRELLKEYFINTSNINRKQLWVLENNKSAIRLYESFGFKFDGLVDYIYIKKK